MILAGYMLKIMFYVMMFVCLFVSLSRIIQKVVNFDDTFWRGALSDNCTKNRLDLGGELDHVTLGFGFGLQLPWWMFALSRCFLFCTAVTLFLMPRAGPWVVRIDLLHFLAGCCTRRLNQTLSLFLSLSLSLSFSLSLSLSLSYLINPLCCIVVY